MIDWNRVSELADEIGAENLGEVVELFLDEVEHALTRLGPVASLEADLHFLKGSASNLGFEGLRAVCAEGELTAAAGHPDEVGIARIVAVYAESKRRFLAGLVRRGLAARSA